MPIDIVFIMFVRLLAALWGLAVTTFMLALLFYPPIGFAIVASSQLVKDVMAACFLLSLATGGGALLAFKSSQPHQRRKVFGPVFAASILIVLAWGLFRTAIFGADAPSGGLSSMIFIALVLASALSVVATARYSDWRPHREIMRSPAHVP